MLIITVCANCFRVEYDGIVSYFTKWHTILGMIFEDDKVIVRRSIEEYQFIPREQF